MKRAVPCTPSCLTGLRRAPDEADRPASTEAGDADQAGAHHPERRLRVRRPRRPHPPDPGPRRVEVVEPGNPNRRVVVHPVSDELRRDAADGGGDAQQGCRPEQGLSTSRFLAYRTAHLVVLA